MVQEYWRQQDSDPLREENALGGVQGETTAR